MDRFNLVSKTDVSYTKSCLNTILKSEIKAEGRRQRAERFKSN